MSAALHMQTLSADALARRADAVELGRLKLGATISALCASAGVNASSYVRNVVQGRPTPSTLAKLEAGLAVLRRASAAPDGTAILIRATYGGFLAAICRALGLDPLAAHAQDPRAGATGSAQWRALAHARQAAIYLANVALAVTQRRLAEALGLTPAAICLALRSVEARRDDPAFDALLDRLQAEITGARP